MIHNVCHSTQQVHTFLESEKRVFELRKRTCTKCGGCHTTNVNAKCLMIDGQSI